MLNHITWEHPAPSQHFPDLSAGSTKVLEGQSWDSSSVPAHTLLPKFAWANPVSPPEPISNRAPASLGCIPAWARTRADRSQVRNAPGQEGPGVNPCRFHWEGMADWALWANTSRELQNSSWRIPPLNLDSSCFLN